MIEYDEKQDCLKIFCDIKPKYLKKMFHKKHEHWIVFGYPNSSYNKEDICYFEIEWKASVCPIELLDNNKDIPEFICKEYKSWASKNKVFK